MAHTPFDPLISLVGRDSDLKSHEPWFSSLERIFPNLQHIGQGLKNGISLQHYSTIFKKLKSVLIITEILIFPGFLSFFHDIIQNFKFP